MQEEKKYNILRLLKIFNLIADMLGGSDVLSHIAVTPNEFSLYISENVSMVLVSELEQLKTIFNPDTVFFNQNHPQLVVSNTSVKQQDNEKYNVDIRYLLSFIEDVSDFICPCTGSETYIMNGEIRIFLDEPILSYSDYIGIYNLFDSNIFFNVDFSTNRPFINILYNDGVLNE